MVRELIGPSLGSLEVKDVLQPPAISVLRIKTTRIIDSSGIPLASDRDPKLAEGIDFEYQEFPFHNSPSRLLQNQPDPAHSRPMSGLERRRLAESYTSMIAIVNYVRRGYLETVANTEPGPLTARELQEVLHGLFYLPHYLALRGKNPIPAQHALPPVVIALSNSASGSAGALDGYLKKHGNSQEAWNNPPVPEEMIEVIETLESKPLVGGKTVCVASPEQMRHFFAAVINGAHMPKATFDASSFLEISETPSLIEFGKHAFYANELMNGLKTLDEKAAALIKKQSRNGRNPRHVRKTRDSFLGETHRLLGELAVSEHRINSALGRSLRIRELSLGEFESQGFEMPGILKEMGIQSPGAIAVIPGNKSQLRIEP